MGSSVLYGKYSPPDLVVEKVIEYKLESTYAHDQLCLLADEVAEKTFMYWMLYIFGTDIEVAAFSKLYRALSDRSFEAPEIIVTKYNVGAHKAGYSNKRRKILVYQNFIDEALEDHDVEVELFAALVEEYGHHIDNLLRTDYSSKPIPDADRIDEGARFAYNFFSFNFFKETKLTYAKVTTPKISKTLALDFSKEQEILKEYTNEKQQYDAIPLADVEYFGAGFIEEKEGFGHGTIEMKALAKDGLFSKDQVLQIYYGNWLRDFSQMIVAITIQAGSKATDYNQKNGSNAPLKMSHQGWVDLLQIFAAKEFVYNVALKRGKELKKPVTENYKVHLETFKKKFGELTIDILGVYRPEEHIDNPYKLPDESGTIDLESGNVVGFTYTTNDSSMHKLLFRGQPKSIPIDPVRNMKSYIHGRGCEAEKSNAVDPSAVTYMSQQLVLACKNGQTNIGFRHLGGALHVLEDYFSHSNFMEISLIKNGASMVYPWVENKQGKPAKQIPLVTGIFLTDDTFASVAPKMAESMFPVKASEYKTRKVGERTFPEGFMETMLTNMAKSQEADPNQKNNKYKGLSTSTILVMLNGWFNFVDWKADMIEKNKDNFAGKSMIFIDKKMNSMGNTLKYLMNISFNIFLSVGDDAIKIVQSLSTGYGDNPTHTQIAKDDPHHPLHKLVAKLAVLAVEDVGKKFKSGMNGDVLAKYVADTYFVHPAMVQNEWITKVDDITKDWMKDKKLIIKKLESPTIYHEHAPDVIRKVDEISGDIKREFEDFKKDPGAYTQKQANNVKKEIVQTTVDMNNKLVEKINKNETLKKANERALIEKKNLKKKFLEIKEYILN
jgi:Heterokaryon incompatibility protein Het-C